LIVYAISDSRKEIVSLTKNRDEIDIEIVFEAEHMNSIEMQRDGWQSILDTFKNYVEDKTS